VSAPSSPQGLALGVVLHPRSEMIGTQLPLRAGEELVLGRALAELDAESDRRLSRQHLRVRVEPEALELEDLDSRNGSFVDGERLTRSRRVVPGATLTVGSVVLHVTRSPPLFASPQSARFVGASAARAQLLELAMRAARSTRQVLLAGETGTGKSLLAEEIHLASGREGRFVVQPAASVGRAEAVERLHGSGGIPGLFELAEGGTLVLDGVEDATSELGAALVAYLDARQTRRVGALDSKPSDVLLILTTRSESTGLCEGRAELCARLSAWTLRLPPLRERRLDIVPVLLHLAGRSEVPELVLTTSLAEALMRSPLLGNVHALENLVSRAVVESPGETLDLEAWMAPMLGVERRAFDTGATSREVAVATATALFQIDRSGGWFDPPGGARVSLEHRKTLQALLKELVRASEGSKPEPLSVEALLAAGWPGERVLPQAGASRVYVAMTTLRRLGLRELIDRRPDGYSLVGAYSVVDG
jgi:two-component system, NtrC family, nitrogen regulation response regulator GlnG